MKRSEGGASGKSLLKVGEAINDPCPRIVGYVVCGYYACCVVLFGLVLPPPIHCPRYLQTSHEGCVNVLVINEQLLLLLLLIS